MSRLDLNHLRQAYRHAAELEAEYSARCRQADPGAVVLGEHYRQDRQRLELLLARELADREREAGKRPPRDTLTMDLFGEG